jgi:hypothetical protein
MSPDMTSFTPSLVSMSRSVRESVLTTSGDIARATAAMTAASLARSSSGSEKTAGTMADATCCANSIAARWRSCLGAKLGRGTLSAMVSSSGMVSPSGTGRARPSAVFARAPSMTATSARASNGFVIASTAPVC